MPDIPAILLVFLFFGVLGASLVLWLRHFFGRRQSAGMTDQTIPGWTIGWVNFGLFICLLVVATTAAQQIGFLFIDPPTGDTGEPALTPWLAVAAICLLQIPLLLAFQASRQLWPHLYGGPLNAHALSIGAAFRAALSAFLRYIPLVWMVSLVWSLVLGRLEDAEIVENVQPQEIVLLFARGGDPIAIAALAFLAVVLAPIVEEVVFRGCIYRFLKTVTPALAAQVVSAALFASLHASLAAFPPLVLLGVLLARSYERSGNLLVPVVFHSIFNAFMLLSLFLISRSSMPGLPASP